MEQDNSSKSDIFEHFQFIKQLNKQVDFQNKKFSDLKIGHLYKVNSFKNITTKFGNRCIVNLLDLIEPSITFDLFLPERYSNIPNKSNINNIGMIYEGFSKTLNRQDYHKIVFT